MAAPSQIVVTYISAPPSTTSTVTVPLPSAGGTQTDDTLAFVNIARAGGLRFTDGAGVLTFIPAPMIVKITSQSGPRPWRPRLRQSNNCNPPTHTGPDL